MISKAMKLSASFYCEELHLFYLELILNPAMTRKYSLTDAPRLEARGAHRRVTQARTDLRAAQELPQLTGR